MYNAFIMVLNGIFLSYHRGSILCTMHKISVSLCLEKWPEERLCATMGHRVWLCVSADLEGQKRQSGQNLPCVFSLRRDNKEKVAHYQSILFLFPTLSR